VVWKITTWNNMDDGFTRLMTDAIAIAPVVHEMSKRPAEIPFQD